MRCTRRRWLAWAAAMGLKWGTLKAGALDIPQDPIAPDPGAIVHGRRYVVRATVTLCGIPLFSRSGVGECYVRYEECPLAQRHAVSIELGAGSFPEKAHGLNKPGVICESVVEMRAGSPAECAYFGFMTTSQEKSLVDGERSLLEERETLTYNAGCGTVTNDGVTSRTVQVRLPSRYSWRDRAAIVREMREGLATHSLGDRSPLEQGSTIPVTFLYAVRKAMRSPDRLTEDRLVFNGKPFVLRTDKQPDIPAGAHVMRLNGTIQTKHGGNRTTFRVWFDRWAQQAPPLRFEYQARSFLHLAFESTGTCTVNPLGLSSIGSSSSSTTFTYSKENA